MIIDIILVILLVMAAIKGYQRGLIVALFSISAFIIGIAAAIKLSAVAASYIGKTISVSEKWLPVITFAVVFIIVVLLVRILANFVQKTIEFGMLGWVNRLGGMLLYAALYIIIYSILLFYAAQMGMLKQETAEASVTYSYIKPIGPKVISSLGTVIPFLKDMFSELQDFFGNVSQQIPPAR